MSFDEIVTRWTWTPIRNCPGRFVLADAHAALEPRRIVGPDVACATFDETTARDPVVVARLPGGGLISYRRPDGTFVHTLNTPDGFARKLAQLGIALDAVSPDAGHPNEATSPAAGTPPTSSPPRPSRRPR